jgi:hypothetical protein
MRGQLEGLLWDLAKNLLLLAVLGTYLNPVESGSDPIKDDKTRQNT